MLTIEAKTAEPDEAAGDGYVLRERRAGSFRRTLRLSDRVDAAAATSRYADGVLTVTVPKLETSKPGGSKSRSPNHLPPRRRSEPTRAAAGAFPPCLGGRGRSKWRNVSQRPPFLRIGAEVRSPLPEGEG